MTSEQQAAVRRLRTRQELTGDLRITFCGSADLVLVLDALVAQEALVAAAREVVNARDAATEAARPKRGGPDPMFLDLTQQAIALDSTITVLATALAAATSADHVRAGS